MMLNSFDVLPLRFRVEAEQREEARQRRVPVLNFAGDLAAFVGEDEAAILFVLEISALGEFLHHAGHGRLFDLEGRSDVDDSRVALLFDQLVNPFEVIFSALARRWRRRHDALLNTVFENSARAGRVRRPTLSGVARYTFILSPRLPAPLELPANCVYVRP